MRLWLGIPVSSGGSAMKTLHRQQREAVTSGPGQDYSVHECRALSIRKNGKGDQPHS